LKSNSRFWVVGNFPDERQSVVDIHVSERGLEPLIPCGN
jgi:hypothetical protein